MLSPLHTFVRHPELPVVGDDVVAYLGGRLRLADDDGAERTVVLEAPTAAHTSAQCHVR